MDKQEERERERSSKERQRDRERRDRTEKGGRICVCEMRRRVVIGYYPGMSHAKYLGWPCCSRGLNLL